MPDFFSLAVTILFLSIGVAITYRGWTSIQKRQYEYRLRVLGVTHEMVVEGTPAIICGLLHIIAGTLALASILASVLGHVAYAELSQNLCFGSIAMFALLVCCWILLIYRR